MERVPDTTTSTASNSATGTGRLAGQVAFISGASRGIGRAIARAFAAQGAALYLTATNADLLASAASEAEQTGGTARFEAFDVSEPNQCAAAADHAISIYGQVDILVNSASVYIAQPFLDYALADFERAMRVNLFGAISLMQALLPQMRDRGHGRIINVASTAAKWASPNRSAYSASKHALVGITRCVALETGVHGVTVNAICPGPVETDMLEELISRRAEIDGTASDVVREAMRNGPAIKRFLDPAEVAELAVYLASPQAAGMTGQSLCLDGGILFL
jgi:meso-butanediol dehydrogenase / (S,S)-butanediol dehydrogenase / diacetyl reductase